MNESLEQKPGCLGLLLKLLAGVSGDKKGKGGAEGPWPFVRNRRGLMSPAEFSFFRVLQQACGERYVVCPKVGLGDVLAVKKGTENFRTWRNKIDRKHIDFVLCDAKTMAVVAGVELDDASHESQKAKERDAVKDKACEVAGLPLLRFKAQRSYDPAKIAQALSKLG